VTFITQYNGEPQAANWTESSGDNSERCAVSDVRVAVGRTI